MTHGKNTAMSILREAPFWFAVALLAACLGAPAPAAEGLRRVHVGDTMPEFSLTGAKGTAFNYQHQRARVLGVVVLQVGESNLQRVVADIKTVVQELRAESPAFDCVGVISGPGGGEFITAHDAGSPALFRLLSDPNFAFWGQLGVIAAPTAVVVGPDGKVQWVRAGYSYDFIAALRAQMRKALHLAGSGDASVSVETLDNASDRARRERRIQLARTLAAKGRMEPAINELQKVYELDPNSAEVALELGEMLCEAGKNEEALKIAAAANIKTDRDKARALLISGRARRQMKQLDAAESLLTEALKLDPHSARALYELGRVHESAGRAEKALECYRRALEEVFAEPYGAEGSHG